MPEGLNTNANNKAELENKIASLENDKVDAEMMMEGEKVGSIENQISELKKQLETFSENLPPAEITTTETAQVENMGGDQEKVKEITASVDQKIAGKDEEIKNVEQETEQKAAEEKTAEVDKTIEMKTEETQEVISKKNEELKVEDNKSTEKSKENIEKDPATEEALGYGEKFKEFKNNEGKDLEPPEALAKFLGMEKRPTESSSPEDVQKWRNAVGKITFSEFKETPFVKMNQPDLNLESYSTNKEDLENKSRFFNIVEFQKAESEKSPKKSFGDDVYTIDKDTKKEITYAEALKNDSYRESIIKDMQGKNWSDYGSNRIQFALDNNLLSPSELTRKLNVKIYDENKQDVSGRNIHDVVGDTRSLDPGVLGKLFEDKDFKERYVETLKRKIDKVDHIDEHHLITFYLDAVAIPPLSAVDSMKYPGFSPKKINEGLKKAYETTKEYNGRGGTPRFLDQNNITPKTLAVLVERGIVSKEEIVKNVTAEVENFRNNPSARTLLPGTIKAIFELKNKGILSQEEVEQLTKV